MKHDHILEDFYEHNTLLRQTTINYIDPEIRGRQ